MGALFPGPVTGSTPSTFRERKSKTALRSRSMSSSVLKAIAYLDYRAEPVIVIGAGIKQDWLTQPMHITGAPAGEATVDWNWSPNRITVKVHRTRTLVRLSPIFPRDTQLRIAYD